ncbi:MAG TPA: YceD family protein [Pseudonocardiaceae bacterium]|jgi:uncharacterized protein|nr:YceD family protein [Pseudonocardiaceae bacterium]
MPQNPAPAQPNPSSPWVIDTRDLDRRPGSMRTYHRDAPAPAGLGLDVIGVPEGGDLRVDLRLESVMEGVLVSGTAIAELTGECARCLDPTIDRLEVALTELFAYPESTTEDTTEPDEVSRIVADLIDLEPVLRDAVILALPQVPLCREDCPGLCPECGGRRAELEPDHAHEIMGSRWAVLKQRFAGTDPGTDKENQ